MVSELWTKHPHLEFGALIDNLIAINGSKKDLFYLKTSDFVQWISNEFAEPETITKESLHQYKAMVTKQYSENPQRFKEEPKSLFIEGEFNKSNYYGGDDIIRLFFDTVYDDNYVDVDFQMALPDGTRQVNLQAHYRHFDLDESYTFVLTITTMHLDTLTDTYDVATFKIGVDGDDKILQAMVNGQVVNEQDYIILLNVIQQSGFDFRTGRYPSEVDKY